MAMLNELQAVLAMGQNLIDKRQCAGSEEAVQTRLMSIADQWEYLTHKTAEKSMKLKEANKQRTYIAAVKDLDFWLGEVESLLTSEDAGKDLASVQNLMKKHQLVDADIQVLFSFVFPYNHTHHTFSKVIGTLNAGPFFCSYSNNDELNCGHV